MNDRSVFQNTLIVVLTLLGAYLFYRLIEIVVLLFVAIMIASAIRPLVAVLVNRGLRPAVAVLVVYVVLLSVVAGLIVTTVPSIVSLLVDAFSIQSVSEIGRALRDRLATFGWTRELNLPVSQIPRQLVELVRGYQEAARLEAGTYTWNALLLVGEIVLALVVGFYWLIARESILDLLLRVSPLKHRERIDLIWNDIEITLSGWMQGEVILSIVIGIASFVGLTLLGVPNAFALAVLAGLTEWIPVVGPLLGAVPAVLVGLGVSLETGVFVALWYLLIQQVEGYFLVPKVMERRIGLHPLVVITALIAGASLDGIGGALLAVPVAGALQVIARHVLIDPAIQRSSPRVMEQGGVLFELEEPVPILKPDE
jgi:predicted PurR-regulated permease PerM